MGGKNRCLKRSLNVQQRVTIVTQVLSAVQQQEAVPIATGMAALARGLWSIDLRLSPVDRFSSHAAWTLGCLKARVNWEALMLRFLPCVPRVLVGVVNLLGALMGGPTFRVFEVVWTSLHNDKQGTV